MSLINVVLNVLWLLLGGLVMTMGWLFASAIMAITIVGLPWARAAFTNAAYTFLPFGQKAISRERLTGEPDLGTGLLGTIGNAIWLVLAGWWLCLLHVVFGIAGFVTIIGIPFGWAHFKLAKLALWPIGQSIVAIDEFRRIQSRVRG